jgi:precorrin-4 methylase
VVRGTLASIAALGRDAAIAPPALLVVGEVAALGAERQTADMHAGRERPPSDRPMALTEDSVER